MKDLARSLKLPYLYLGYWIAEQVFTTNYTAERRELVIGQRRQVIAHTSRVDGPFRGSEQWS